MIHIRTRFLPMHTTDHRRHLHPDRFSFRVFGVSIKKNDPKTKQKSRTRANNSTSTLRIFSLIVVFCRSITSSRICPYPIHLKIPVMFEERKKEYVTLRFGDCDLDSIEETCRTLIIFSMLYLMSLEILYRAFENIGNCEQIAVSRLYSRR